ncbi:hypothetical protein DSECCO2_508510 [anaerobic digester metagenome]|nr:MAG: hypothetical protein CVV29_03245 [Methanobacteriales archaeon HGW-Methanobacteriales-2]
MNYLICDKCNGYYKLQHGETPEDFVLECDCGGNLKIVESLENIREEVDLNTLGICPSCNKATPLNANFCQSCGEKIDKIESIDDKPKSEKRVIACNECHYVHELSEDEKITDFDVCECGGEFIYYENREEYFKSKEYFETFLNSNNSSPTKLVANTVNKLIKSETLEDKKSKYGFLIAAKGIEGVLELYDNWLRLPGKEYLLLEDISSIDFQTAQGLRGRGYIKFNLRGMDRENKQTGAMLFYNRRTGYSLGIGGAKDGKGGMIVYNPRTGYSLGIGGYKDSKPLTKIKFTKEWESEFKVIKNIIYTKILERKGLEKIEFENKEFNELEMLAELKNKGIITEDEFEAKKN